MAGPLVCLIFFLGELRQMGQSGDWIPKVVTWSWVPSLDVDLTFFLDGFGLLFALLISAVGTMVFLYAGGYLADSPKLGRFYGWIGLFFAAMLGLVFGLNPGLIDQELIAPAKSAVMGQAFDVELKLYSGINLPLLLSVFTVAGGVLMIKLYPKWRALKLPLAVAEAVFERLLAAILAGADRITRITQNGQIDRYVATIVLAVSGFVAVSLLRSGADIGLSQIR